MVLQNSVGSTPANTRSVIGINGIQTLIDAATITFNLLLGLNGAVTIGGNRSLSITNPSIGDGGYIRITQDATGGRSLTLPANSVVLGVATTAIALNSASGAVTLLRYFYDGTNYYWESIRPFRQTFNNADVAILASTTQVAQTGTLTASRTATLPAANSVAPGTEIELIDESGGASGVNKIIVARSGTDTINGLSTYPAIISPYGAVRVIGDGSSKWTAVNTGISKGTSLLLVASGTSIASFGGRAFNTIVLTAIIDPYNAYASGIYTAPLTGDYDITTKLRLADGSPLYNYGQGVNTSNADGAWMLWANTATGASPTNRSTLMNNRKARFSAGDQIRMYAYLDSAGTFTLNQAEMTIAFLGV